MRQRLFAVPLLLTATLLASEQASPTIVSIAGVSTGNEYRLGQVARGAQVYSDRRYALQQFPDELVGSALIRTSNEDDQVRAAEHLRLRLHGQATLYVCWDDRAYRPAEWLRGWHRVRGSIDTDDTEYRLYRQTFPAGDVTLGGNSRSETGARGNYFVIVARGGADERLTTVGLVDDAVLAPAPNTEPDKNEDQGDGDDPELKPLLTMRPPVVPAGFAVKLFAREPLIHNPTALCFDRRGRLMVGHGPQYRMPRPETPGDQVLIVIDDNDDGVADRTHVFAEGFNSIQGLTWKGDQLWIANSPDLTMVRDLDGDDTADEYVRIYTDLGNLEHSLHGLHWAPDGMLYMSKGNSKGHNRPEEDGRVAPQPFRELFGQVDPPGAPDMPEPVWFTPEQYAGEGKGYHDPGDDWGRQGGVLRCDSMGNDLEIVSRGLRNPWDIAFDDGFDWLGTDNDQDQGDKIFSPVYGGHFGWGHAWSYDWLGHDHLPTVPASAPLFEGSGAGIVYYSAWQFPEEYRHVFFINDWLSRRTYVLRPTWQGALRQRHAAESPLEVFAEEDERGLYQPTDLEVGPDGALYVNGWGVEYGVDWVPGEENRTQRNEGRIFRIWYQGRPLAKRTDWYASHREQPISSWSLEQLIADLGERSLPVWRVNAQREIVRRGARVQDAVRERLRRGAGSKMEETWLAWALGRVTPQESELDAFFADAAVGGGNGEESPSLNLRIQALRILARRCRGGRPLPPAVETALRDREPRIRFAAAQAIWQARDKTRVPQLLELAAGETDRTTYYTLWQALRELATLEARKQLLDDPRPQVRLAALLGLMDDFALTKADVLRRVAVEQDPQFRQWGLKWTLTGRPPRTVSNRPERLPSEDRLSVEELLKQLAAERQPALRRSLLELLASLRVQGDDWTTLRNLYQELATVAVTDDEQAAFLTALAFDPRSHPLLWEQLSSRPEVVWEAAVDGLSRPTAREFVWRELPPAADLRQRTGGVAALVRQWGDGEMWSANATALDALVRLSAETDDLQTHHQVLTLLVAAKPESLPKSGELREQLLYVARTAADRGDPRIQGLAARLAQSLGVALALPLREPVTAEDVLPLLEGASPTAGAAIFFNKQRAHCGACHRVAGRGIDFAPPLDDIGRRLTATEMLESILHPNRKITEGFAVTQLETTDGRSVAGVVRSESDSGLRLFQADGRWRTVASETIAARSLSQQSLMPANFGLLLTPQELAHVVAWLGTQRDRRSPVTEQVAPDAPTAAQLEVEFTTRADHIAITANGQPLATYYFADPRITRPYFAHVHAPGGIQVTRNHPPRPGDPDDHADYHPGIWLAFGDLSGSDFWRLKARVVHDGFVDPPRAVANRGSFTVRNRYLSGAGARTLCQEVCRYTFEVSSETYRIGWDSRFSSSEGEFSFGDQEEMGLGVRVATALRETGGNGRLLNSNRLAGADATWGQPAAWCDYAGTIGDPVGVTIMAAPDNLRPSWWHNRAYGVFVANLFGRSAMRQGPPSKIVVQPGETFWLGYGILLHAARDRPLDLDKEYRRYLDSLAAGNWP